MLRKNNFFVAFFILLLFSNLYFIFQNKKQQRIIDELKKETVEQRQIVNKNEIIAKVERVIDGDTIVLEGKGKIRLANINAPELEYCLGKEAKNAGYTKSQQCYGRSTKNKYNVERRTLNI
jgi:endonuclease YncB( thermonuclease family)